MFFFSSPSPSPNTALGGPDPFVPLLRYANHRAKKMFICRIHDVRHSVMCLVFPDERV